MPLAGGGELLYLPGFLAAGEAERLYSVLRDTIPWGQRPVTLFGRSYLQPRLVAWIGDVGYTYSGLSLEPAPWPEPVIELRRRVATRAKVAAERFDGVLLNYYRDGRDTVGFHADDEREIVPGAAIAAVSLGTTRRFVLKPKRGGARVELRLESGSLLLMAGPVQRDWLHAVPREARVREGRISLTFRQHRAGYSIPSRPR